MIQKTKGVVLHSLKYGDNGIIASIYTEVFGRMSFILQGIHGKKTSVTGKLIRQLFLLELEVDHQPNRELQRVREIRNIMPYGSIPFEIAKSSQAIFLSEVLNQVLREEEPNPELFHFLFRSLQILDLLKDGVNNFHLIFLLQLTRYLGFEPTNNYSESNAIFDLMGGKFVSNRPNHPWILIKEESAAFSLLLTLNYEKGADFKPNQELREAILNSIINFYGLHIGNKLHLKSLEVLREILH